ncbi:MAG: hypothetical protein IME92_06885 [Proteobacteria bacterium]|nr:hypothetical protein [Pseudomonadota bacterium]
MRFQDEIFGSEAQKTVATRARDLWRTYKNDGRYSYNGRAVVLTECEGDDTADLLISLTQAQGATACLFLPLAQSEKMQNAIRASGLSSNLWTMCRGRKSTYDAANRILNTYSLPEDLTVECLSQDTETHFVESFASMVTDCGVLVMSGRVMRGLDIPGVTLAAIDGAGNPVASAWGYKCYHEKSGYADHAFWGGLSCRKDRRGHRIALILGAMSIVRLWDEFQVRGFCTGVAAGNTASFSVCEKLGISPSDYVGFGITDPAMFQGGSLTR